MINEITKKLNGISNKVDLKAEKIELGVADDISKMTSDLNAEIQKMESALKSMEDANKAIIKANQDADKVESQSMKVRDTAEKANSKVANVLSKADSAANDLGVDPKSIKGYTALDKLYFDVEALSKKINSFSWVSAS